MKYLFLFICIACNCLVNYAQNDNIEINEEGISKDWIFLDIINPNKTSEEIEEIKYFLEDNTISFHKDMTYEFSFVMDLKGTWELIGNVIYTKDEKGENSWTIHKLTKDKLHISRNESEQIIIYTIR